MLSVNKNKNIEKINFHTNNELGLHKKKKFCNIDYGCG